MKTNELTNALIIIRDRTTDQWEREVVAEACNRLVACDEVRVALSDLICIDKYHRTPLSTYMQLYRDAFRRAECALAKARGETS